ncbi:hypothetical protein bAD24_III05035 [Burkholderia sp. AD24]|nr:hypothetical protein bAD24_III05035 [Burkholderia sp. AD24]
MGGRQKRALTRVQMTDIGKLCGTVLPDDVMRGEMAIGDGMS